MTSLERIRMIRYRLVSLSVAPLLLLFSTAWSAEPAKPMARDLLQKWIQTFQPDGPEWKALLSDGAGRSDFCARCHGKDGVSVMPLVPNLAGQNVYYLLEQIEQFADGRRRDFIMSPLAKQFTQEDKAIVAFFYANMKPPRMTADAAATQKGGALFGQRCVGCHGGDAHGGDKIARLAGQQPVYIKHRLQAFKDGNMKASNSPMVAITQGLSEQEMEAVASYLSSLP